METEYEYLIIAYLRNFLFVCIITGYEKFVKSSVEAIKDYIKQFDDIIVTQHRFIGTQSKRDSFLSK